MKYFILITTLIFASSSFADDGPFLGIFGIKTNSPLEIVAAADQLNKECKNPDGVTVTLMSENLNGSEEMTHSYLVGFPNNAAYVDWTNSISTCPGWAKYFEAVQPISESVTEALAFPLAGGGDASKDSVFVNFFVNVSRPDKFLPAYNKLMEDNEGCPGSWGLFAMGPGVQPEEYGTHIAFCGYPDLASYMEQAQVRVPTKEFQRFIRKTFRISEIKGITSSSVVKRYN